MGMPAELLEAFDRLNAEGQAEEPSKDTQFEKALEEVDRSLGALNQNWNGIEEAAILFSDAIKADIEAGIESAQPDLDFAVRFLEDQEQKFRTTYLPRLKKVQQMQREVFTLPQPVRGRALATHRKQIATYTRLLEGIRDLKMRLIALRALAEPPGDAPTFSDADALERYLDAL
jgi:hypothetical protein